MKKNFLHFVGIGLFISSSFSSFATQTSPIIEKITKAISPRCNIHSKFDKVDNLPQNDTLKNLIIEFSKETTIPKDQKITFLSHLLRPSFNLGNEKLPKICSMEKTLSFYNMGSILAGIYRLNKGKKSDQVRQALVTQVVYNNKDSDIIKDSIFQNKIVGDFVNGFLDVQLEKRVTETNLYKRRMIKAIEHYLENDNIAMSRQETIRRVLDSIHSHVFKSKI